MSEFVDSKLSPKLARWCAQAPREEEKSVLLRPAYSVGQDRMKQDLEQAGTRVESLGQGGVSLVVSPASLAQVSNLDWVVRVEEPRRLDFKSFS